MLLFWFFFSPPGFKKMQANMKKIDCVIEVHDARVSFSSHWGKKSTEAKTASKTSYYLTYFLF